jgi:hypothetical protein
MSGAIPLLPLYAFMAWTGTNLTIMIWQQHNTELQAGAKRKRGTNVKIFFFPPMARQPLGGLGRLIFRGFTITL